jgi:L-ascorbate metabolism protein UlaG (beta-lactamase superfamily)
MVHADFRVEMIGHATLRVQSGGRTLLTDPWLVDPMVCGGGFHFPPLVHDAAAVAAETDAIYVSHVHPDHLHHPSLALFSRDTPVYIGAYRRKEFRDELRRLGFPVVEVPFRESVEVAGTPLRIWLLEHDADETAAYDSAIVIRTPEFSLFENNDCFLRPAKYAWVRERFAVDYAFLGYSPASFFPIAFELPPEEKAALLAEAGERRYAEFVEAAELLRPALSVPFASGLRFLEAGALWKNVLFNSADEAVRRVRARGLAAEVMGPGDRIAADGTLRRVSAVLRRDEELGAIAAYAHGVQARVAARAEDELPPAADLVGRFRDYILGLWRDTRARLPGVREHVIAYVLRGPPEQRFYFDFSRPDDAIFAWGDPPRYDMRYTYPARALQQCLDGRIDWDELHFTFDVSVHQIRYARDFYRMLRSEVLDLG